ncbi:MAG: UDP-N-acetylmuramoyl-tripeptide--D-alanyl-D-alanine ligase, partial [Phenylobacterium sp.]
MITVSTQWINEALTTELDATLVGDVIDISNVSTDTRTITVGDLFIALKGPNFDGHKFVAKAIEQGAGAVIVDHQLDIAIPQIIVTDTTRALGQLSAAIKAKMQLKTIAITGSVGKTTVKEMTASILSGLGRVLATKGNFNNEIGVPLTLLRLQPEDDFAVIELGANHSGEIAYTTGLTQPDVTLVNNVAAAHLEGFVDLHGVARAKGEIFTHSGDETIAVVNNDSDYAPMWLRRLANRPVMRFSLNANKDVNVWAENICSDEYGCATFELCYRQQAQDKQLEKVSVKLASPGRHNVANALAAACVTLSVGASMTDVSQGLGAMTPVNGRVNLIKVSDQLIVIDDTYNANVSSAKAAIDLLTENAGTTIFVFGDMGELGQDARRYHEEVGNYARQKKIDQLFTLGVLSQNASEAFAKGDNLNNSWHFSC